MQTEIIQDLYPLSPMQQGMLFHKLYAPDDDAYVEQVSCTIYGVFDVVLFREVWQVVVERHQTLHTSFVWEGVDQPLAIVHRQAALDLDVCDWQHLTDTEQRQQFEGYLRADLQRGFDLTTLPLMRLALFRLGPEKYHFLWSFHHIILDGWSISLVLEEVFTIYRARSKGIVYEMTPPRPYRDYIAWLQQQDLSHIEEYWRGIVGTVTTATPLPMDTLRKGVRGGEAGHEERALTLSPAQTQALQALARSAQVTLSTLARGAWAILLSRYSGQVDVLYGVTVAGRPDELPGIESMVGLFINTLPIRVLVREESLLLPWLQMLQRQQAELVQYEHSPLVQVQGWSKVPRGQSLFDSLLVFENFPSRISRHLSEGGVTVNDIHLTEATNYPLTVVITPADTLSIRIIYDLKSFAGDAIDRMLGHIRALLVGMVERPHGRLADLPLITQQEHQQWVVEWNRTNTPYRTAICAHNMIEIQVEQQPDAIAVIYEDGQFSYSQLNQRANQLAHYLQCLGVTPETRVGICVERSVEMVVALIGVLKAGGAYVPIDPEYPRERVAFMIADAQLGVLLTQHKLSDRLPETRARLVCLDSDWPEIDKQPLSNPQSAVRPENLFYLIYTSGSTGWPKGTAYTHASFANLLWWLSSEADLPGMCRALQLASFSFDDGSREILSTLCAGGTLILISEIQRRDLDYLWSYLHEAAVEFILAPFSVLRHFARIFAEQKSVPTSLKKIITAGEQFQVTRQVQALFTALPGCTLQIQYGSSEVFVATYYTLQGSPDTWPSLPPVGVPMSNAQVYVLDRSMQPVPVGVPGEIFVGGAGVARGYFDRPDLTAERFLPNPFSDQGGSRIYATGDIGYYSASGTLEFLGRRDHQVKIRGFRIELGEIEVTLAQHPAIRECVVMAREDVPGDRRLVAYIVLEDPEQRPSVETLRLYLLQRLPDYMLPAVFVVMDTLPLNPNRKVDRFALPAPSQHRPEMEKTYTPPQQSMQEVLAGIWAGVLALEEVGVHDNFFDLGGHSLVATQVISRVREAFHIDLPVRTLFDAPTIASFAVLVKAASDTARGVETPPILPRTCEVPLPLSYAQERLWFMERLFPGSQAYNLVGIVRIEGQLDATALQLSITQLVARHEVLRTVIRVKEERPYQQIVPSTEILLPLVDLCVVEASQRERTLWEYLRQEKQKKFDLEQGPLFHLRLFKCQEQEYFLFVALHHLVADGWSLHVFMNDMRAFYAAAVRKVDARLPALPIQYADYALWQRQWLKGERLQQMMRYWRMQLADAPLQTTFPTDFRRPQVLSLEGATYTVSIPEATSKTLRALSLREGTTLFMTLLTVFSILLHHYSGQDDLVIGTDVANRTRQETEQLIGFFVNVLALRANLSQDPTLRGLLQQMRQTTLEAYVHQDLPFELLVEELNPPRSSGVMPLVQLLFVLLNTPEMELTLPDLRLSMLPSDTSTAKFDLAVFISETKPDLTVAWNYNTTLFQLSTIECLAEDFSSLLGKMAQYIDEHVSALEKDVSWKKGGTSTVQRRPGISQDAIQRVARRPINLTQLSLVKEGQLQPGQSMPLLLEPSRHDVDLVEWGKNNRELLETKLLAHRAILLRGFAITTPAMFEQVAQVLCPDLFGEYGDLPRAGVGGKIYASTPYPSDRAILFHNESSHMHQWPLKQWFFCMQDAHQGGETPIIDCSLIYRLMDQSIRTRLENQGLLYVRRFSPGLDVSWQEFFRTTNPPDVEAYCRDAHMEWEWSDDGCLTTSQRCPAVLTHPVTHEKVFFNQIFLHHIACLEQNTRESLEVLLGKAHMPRNVYYGDETPIEDHVIHTLLELYWNKAVRFKWQKGDILLLDNMLVAHGRMPFSGSRRILVALGQMIERDSVWRVH